MAEATNNKKQDGFLQDASSFMWMLVWVALGLAFFYLAVIIRFHEILPAKWTELAKRYIPHLAYFVGGFGFICLGHARDITRKQYMKERKNILVQTSHSWKGPLLIGQVFLLYGAGIYAILFGIGKLPEVGILGLGFFVLLFLLYLLWYQIEHFKHRMPALASVRISLIALFLAGASFVLWIKAQVVAPSLILGAVAVGTALLGLLMKGKDVPEQKMNWLQVIFVLGTIGLAGSVGYFTLTSRTSITNTLNLAPMVKNLEGEVDSILFSPDGTGIAIIQNVDDAATLKLIKSGTEGKPLFTSRLGRGKLHPIFGGDGSCLYIDPINEGQRGLSRIDAETGKSKVLVSGGVQPLNGGVRASAENGFLYVVRAGNQYKLYSVADDETKPTALYTSGRPIFSPSWVGDGSEVAFADGISGTPFILNVANKEVHPLVYNQEKGEENGKLEDEPVNEIIPSPDHFRYLCVAHRDGKTFLWTSMLDGSMKGVIYKTDKTVTNVSWLPDGQKILFQETGVQSGFSQRTSSIRVVDANLRSVENLIPSQADGHSPVCSPDGIKIAFVGSEALWYPSINSAIWVAVLR